MVATLRPEDPVAPSAVPDLYHPTVVMFALMAFRLRGFERLEATEGQLAVVQEWHCELPPSRHHSDMLDLRTAR